MALHKPNPERLERFAYENRRELTRAEAAMVNILNDLKWRFNVEHPKHRENIIVDFLVPHHRLIVEVDGGYHESRKDKDRRRDRALVRRGYSVQRFTNEQVLDFPRKTKATLLKRIEGLVMTMQPKRVPPATRIRDVFVPGLPAVFHETKL